METTEKTINENYREVKQFKKIKFESYVKTENGQIKRIAENQTLKFSEKSASQQFKALYYMFFDELRTYADNSNGNTITVKHVSFSEFKKNLFHKFIDVDLRRKFYISALKKSQLMKAAKGEDVNKAKVIKTVWYWKSFLLHLVNNYSELQFSFNVDDEILKLMEANAAKNAVSVEINEMETVEA